MNWEGFYLVCFLVGFGLSIALLTGSAHLHLHHGGNGNGNGSFLNFGTVSAFLAWFGGAGYLLTRYSSIWTLIALGIAFVTGIAGAAAVFWFVFKVLLAHEKNLDPADYEMVGVLGRVSSTLRPGGTGEVIFTQDGARRASGARSESGREIAKGVEVVVTRYEHGVAYVRPWDELAGTAEDAAEVKEN